jgi:diguanylate cyclase (GGDEF)-like protein
MDSTIEFLQAERARLQDERRALLEEIAYLKKALEESSRDDLTGLLRRKVFDEFVQKEINLWARSKAPFSIFVIDLNDLKKVNDTYGHLAGDDMIVSFATLLKVSLRDCDVVARGSAAGDEFLVLLPGEDENGALGAKEHLLRQFEKMRTHMLPAFYGAAIGVATVSTDLGTFELLYKAADMAMFEHKREMKRQE